MMCAMRDVAEQDRVRVHLVVVADEESDNPAQRGSDYLVEKGYTGDFAITGEPTDLKIGVQAKGVLGLRIEVHGKAAHGSTPWRGRQRGHQGGRRASARSRAMPFASESTELFDAPVRSRLGRIMGGDAMNKVPDRAVDRRRHPLPAGPGPEGDPRPDRGAPRHRRQDDLPPRARDRQPQRPVRADARRLGRGGLVRRPHLDRPRRRERRDQLPRRGRAGRRVRPLGRRPPRPRGVGVDRVAGAVPQGARRVHRPRSANRPPATTRLEVA